MTWNKLYKKLPFKVKFKEGTYTHDDPSYPGSWVNEIDYIQKSEVGYVYNFDSMCEWGIKIEFFITKEVMGYTNNIIPSKTITPMMRTETFEAELIYTDVEDFLNIVEIIEEE